MGDEIEGVVGHKLLESNGLLPLAYSSMCGTENRSLFWSCGGKCLESAAK